jgi:LysM repeat protein
MRLDEVGSLVRRVVQETTERVTQFATTQTVTKDRPATVVTAGAQGQQPTYPMAPSFYSPAYLFRPVQYSPSPAPGAPATPPPLQIDLTSAPAGQTIYEVQPGDSLNNIAAQHGLTADDIRLTNPQYADGQIDPGDKLFLYYDKAHPDVAAERLDIARKIKATSDPAELASLVQQDLQLATRYSAIPGDSVPGVKTHLLGLKPGDQGFAKIVNTEVDKALTGWDAQGRTHEVWDPLIQAAEAGDWGKFEEVLLQQFGTAAATTPTTQTVENHKNMLLTFGPKDPAFRTAVEGGTNEFLIGRPQRAAGQVAQAFEEGGAVAGANKLKELTDPAKVDPLTAALILKASRPTVDKIVNVAASYDPSPADPYSGPPPANQRFDITDYHLVFSGLNSAADSASRSPEGMPEVTHIAGRLNASPVLSPMGSYYPNVNFAYQNSVAQGDGVVLLLEMAKLAKTSGDPHKAGALTRLVVGGVEDLKENVRTQVGNLGEAALPLVEPIANWGGRRAAYKPVARRTSGAAGQDRRGTRQARYRRLRAQPRHCNGEPVRSATGGYQAPRSTGGARQNANPRRRSRTRLCDSFWAGQHVRIGPPGEPRTATARRSRKSLSHHA